MILEAILLAVAKISANNNAVAILPKMQVDTGRGIHIITVIQQPSFKYG